MGISLDSGFYEDFPLLRSRPFKVTSPASDRYNCIAYAAGDRRRRWWPHEDHYWPFPLPSKVTVATIAESFNLLFGYQGCTSAELEHGVAKIAIFALANGEPTHRAVQMTGGPDRWRSKIGKNHDIEHCLRDLEGPLYGRVAIILSAPVTRKAKRSKRNN
jgi:hypothetical protein